jgi:hypothetical protein
MLDFRVANKLTQLQQEIGDVVFLVEIFHRNFLFNGLLPVWQKNKLFFAHLGRVKHIKKLTLLFPKINFVVLGRHFSYSSILNLNEEMKRNQIPTYQISNDNYQFINICQYIHQ